MLYQPDLIEQGGSLPSPFKILEGESDDNGLNDTFFHVVNVEEKFHLTRRVAELRDVCLEILLHLLR
jgi:hypothetical protein